METRIFIFCDFRVAAIVKVTIEMNTIACLSTYTYLLSPKDVTWHPVLRYTIEKEVSIEFSFTPKRLLFS